MHMEYDVGTRTLNVAHDNPRINLSFDCSTVYYVSVFKELEAKEGIKEGSLEYVNKFMQSRSMQDQAALADYYSRAHSVLYDSMSSYILDENLPGLLTSFPTMRGFRPEDVLAWVNQNVTPPPNIMDSYKNDAHGIYSREQTYIRSEYMDLAALIIYSKLLIPIMGEYMRRLNTRYKSIAADINVSAQGEGTLDFKAHVELTMLDMLSGFMAVAPGVDRLMEFITVSIANGVVKPEVVIMNKQISTEDLPQYVFAVIFTKKLVAGALFGTERNHLASRLFTNIWSIVAPSNDRMALRLTNDGVSKETGDDAKSVFDDTVSAYHLSVGQVAILHYTTSEEYLNRFTQGRIDMDLCQQLWTKLQQGEHYITQFHIACIGHTLANVVNPVILSNCDAVTILRLLCVTYLLIRDEHPVVAKVMMGFPMLDEHRIPLADHVELTKITPAILNSLTDNYPLQNKRGTPLIVEHIQNMEKCLQYVWVGIEMSDPSLHMDGFAITIPPETLHKYSSFICVAPYILDPECPE